MQDIEVKFNKTIYKNQPNDSFDDNFRSNSVFNVNLPKIDINSQILSIGSCFAHHIRKSLSNLGIKTNDYVFYDDQLTTTIAIKEYFEWISKSDNLVHDIIHYRQDKTTLGLLTEDNIKSARIKYENTLKNATCVIITYGLSEVWFDEETGRSVWKWPGKEKSSKLSFKLMSARENAENIRETVNLIRKINQNTSIVITLSPVPLLATFRTDCKINIANCSSKSRLRSGIDEFFEINKDQNVYY